MPPKRNAEAAGLGGLRRSTRLRLQQSDALHRNNGDDRHDEQDVDELASNDPAHTVGPPERNTGDSASSIPTPPKTRKRPRQKATSGPPPPPPLELPLLPRPPPPPSPRKSPSPSPSESSGDSPLNLDLEQDWKEPDYVKTYRYFSDQLNKLTGWCEITKDDKGNERSGRKKSDWEYHNGDIWDKLCEPYFGFDAPPNSSKDRFLQALGEMEPAAARIISYVTMGGPNGRDDWYRIFWEPETRKAVVYAVVGFILQEHVFSSLCFGASDAEIQKLHVKVDLKYHENHDGFYRTKKRARRVRELLFDQHGNPQPVSSGFIAKSKELTWQIYAILEGILILHPKSAKRQVKKDKDRQLRLESQQKILRVLFELVTRAGRLSLQMRLDADTVYFMTPAHKDEHYDASSMWVLNDDYMRRNNRFHNARWEGMPETKPKQWKAAIFDLALVRICCFPGFLAFKKGGWDKKFKNMGVRLCQLQGKVVALRWGSEKPFDPDDGTWEEWYMVWGRENKLLPAQNQNVGVGGSGAGGAGGS
ncbi:uncharacterized protein IWZ02DRAFT_260999 [Phyllosticta citriasiana]|uniref:uncharacterized protein n=1 Tax=Phyllosticta citriasiana TaxID=595635 RepID=UPI0030FD7B5D